MVATIPRFRTDLVATPLEIEGKRFIDVTDPNSEQTFRFYEIEYSVACAMDGQRDMDGLMQWSKEELGLEPSRDEIETVVNTLEDLGYLDAAGGSGRVELGASGNRSLPSPPPAGSVTMGWDVPAADPEQLEALMGKQGLGPAGLAAKAAEVAASAPPAARNVTMGWDAQPVDPEELEALMGRSKSAKPVPDLERTSRLDDDDPTQIPDALPEYGDDDLSVDLSDHLSIDTNDVKEAVRQSKTMDAVQVPPELLAELEDQPTKTGAELVDEATSQAAPVVAPVAERADASRPIELPAMPPTISNEGPGAMPAEQAPAAAAKRGVGAPFLVLALVVVAVAVGAYFLVFENQDDDGATNPTTADTTETTEPVTKSPKGKPVIASKLAASDADVAQVLAIADGVIATIAVAGEEVAEGAVVASLKGVARVERALARPRRRLMDYSKKLKSAKDSGASSRTIARYEAKVAEKKGLVTTGEAKLEALQMHASMKGVVEPLVEAGANVKKDEPVVQIVGRQSLSATFPTKETFEVGRACKIAPVREPTKLVPCKIDSIEPGKVTIRIPQDIGFAAGDAVILR